MFGLLSRGGRRPNVVPTTPPRTPNPDREIIVEIEVYLRSLRNGPSRPAPQEILAMDVAATAVERIAAERPAG